MPMFFTQTDSRAVPAIDEGADQFFTDYAAHSLCG